MTCVILLSSASGRFKNFLTLIAAAEKRSTIPLQVIKRLTRALNSLVTRWRVFVHEEKVL